MNRSAIGVEKLFSYLYGAEVRMNNSRNSTVALLPKYRTIEWFHHLAGSYKLKIAMPISMRA
ncbi:hypothetical protein [Chroococcidiopsis sp.]|uniref:hypothetical protein n=1 Tax=Chroococcidiopsis sp. TaxID=3088168 RepID=UPI003F3BAFE8